MSDFQRNTFLNEAVRNGKWDVDTGNPDKILTVEADEITKADVIKAVEKAG